MTRTSAELSPILLTPKETSTKLGRSLNELRTWRRQNIGPKFHTLGGRLIRYSASAVHEYATTSHADARRYTDSEAR